MSLVEEISAMAKKMKKEASEPKPQKPQCAGQNLELVYGFVPLPETDSDSDSCTVQDFSTGSDLDSDPLIQMYGIGMEICPWDGDLSLKWVQ